MEYRAYEMFDSRYVISRIQMTPSGFQEIRDNSQLSISGDTKCWVMSSWPEAPLGTFAGRQATLHGMGCAGTEHTNQCVTLSLRNCRVLPREPLVRCTAVVVLCQYVSRLMFDENPNPPAALVPVGTALRAAGYNLP